MKKVTIDNNSLAHTKWDCKYHIVFAPKYRRKVFFEEKRVEIREILRQLCQWKGVEIIEGGSMPRPHTYVGKHPTQNERFVVYGLPKRKKRIIDISEMGEYEICI
jgi:hypothetical protein